MSNLACAKDIQSACVCVYVCAHSTCAHTHIAHRVWRATYVEHILSFMFNCVERLFDNFGACIVLKLLQHERAEQQIRDDKC